ncbi:Uncharacterised protein [Mycobacterium xenopi]|nr:Uncharacterised protein [Mycobacterium xenopi]
MSSGAGPGRLVLGWVLIRGSLMSMTATSWPSSRSASPVVVITARGAASASMNPTRASGSAGSMGRYAAPLFNTPRIAMIASAQRGNNNATHDPAPAP